MVIIAGVTETIQFPNIFYTLVFQVESTGLDVDSFDFRKEFNSFVSVSIANWGGFESDVPHSIYEIEGARSCAVEFRSFSKTAGFTGVRCGYTVVPEEVKAMTASGEQVALNHLWNRRQCTKFNGTSYITQRGAEAIYTAEGQAEIKETIAYYMENARLMREGLHAAGFTLYGGVNAPYIWVKAPEGLDSWSFFEMLLHEVNVVGTPGVGFGPSGEGFLRLTAFGKREEDCQEAMNRIKNWAGR